MGSFAGRIGHTMAPVFEPLGFDWQLTVGVLTSFLAREVFVSTMSVLASGQAETDVDEGVVTRIRGMTRDDGRPLFTPATAAAALVFFVLAMQCLPTLAVTRQGNRQHQVRGAPARLHVDAGLRGGAGPAPRAARRWSIVRRALMAYLQDAIVTGHGPRGPGGSCSAGWLVSSRPRRAAPGLRQLPEPGRSTAPPAAAEHPLVFIKSPRH